MLQRCKQEAQDSQRGSILRWEGLGHCFITATRIQPHFIEPTLRETLSWVWLSCSLYIRTSQVYSSFNCERPYQNINMEVPYRNIPQPVLICITHWCSWHGNMHLCVCTLWTCDYKPVAPTLWKHLGDIRNNPWPLPFWSSVSLKEKSTICVCSKKLVIRAGQHARSSVQRSWLQKPWKWAALAAKHPIFPSRGGLEPGFTLKTV